jgi:hypothetical protein
MSNLRVKFKNEPGVVDITAEKTAEVGGWLTFYWQGKDIGKILLDTIAGYWWVATDHIPPH